MQRVFARDTSLFTFYYFTFYYVVNPFHTTGLFIYPLKTSEYLWFFMFLGGIEKDQWHHMG